MLVPGDSMGYTRSLVFSLCVCAVVLCLVGLPADGKGKSGDNGNAPAQKDSHLREGASDIVVSADEDSGAVPLDVILPWLQRSAHSISTYFGRFPVKSLVIRISTQPGVGVGYSTANLEEGQPVIHIRVGAQVSKEELNKDWVATHEMVHLAFPLVERKEDWVAEGMATYVEPIARMQAGNLSAQDYWHEFTEMLPRGLPRNGDGGLNGTSFWKGTHSIRRMYWGGALFYFMADLQIRSETNNKKGLQDAFAAIMNAGGDVYSDWDALHAFQVGDRAIGSSVLEKMYKVWARDSVPVDLSPIWTKLGIIQKDGKISFDNTAPLAATRQAIEKGLVQK
jgi:hypothetical protein